MYTRLFVILMVTLAILGLITGVILYFNYDPSYHPTVALIIMGTAVVLTFGSILGLFLLWIKKILARGFLYPIAAFRSLRHGVLITMMFVSGYIFHRYDVLNVVTGILLLCIIFLLELILTKIEDK